MPREIPSESQIAKLPVWAQTYIKALRSERDSAVKTLLQFRDEDTPSNIFYDVHPCIGEGTTGKETEQDKKNGPTFIRRYIQSRRVQFSLPRAEMELEVHVNEPEQRVEIRTPKGYPYIEPQGNNIFHLVPKEDMYLTPNATTLCRASLDADKLDFDAFVKKYGFSQKALPDMIKKVVPASHWNRTVGG